MHLESQENGAAPTLQIISTSVEMCGHYKCSLIDLFIHTFIHSKDLFTENVHL